MPTSITLIKPSIDDEKPKCSTRIQQRYILVLLCFIGFSMSQAMRRCLQMAIVEMSPPTPYHINKDSCPAPNDTTMMRINATEAALNGTTYLRSYVHSVFYYTYITTHLPAGLIADSLGGKHVFGFAILIPSFLTLLSPLIIEITKWNSAALMILRMLTGAALGMTHPALSAILAQWIPRSERSLCGTLAFGGSIIGDMVGISFSGIIMNELKRWSIMFYIYGFIGVIWWIFWIAFAFSRPYYSPFISKEETEYLHQEIDHSVTRGDKIVPWRDIITSSPVWALVISQIGHDWGWHVLLAGLPAYLKEILRFNIYDNDYLLILPYMSMYICAIVFAILADWIINKEYLQITTTRKLFTALGFLGSGWFTVISIYIGCDKVAAIGFFTTGMGFMGAYYSGSKVNVLDISPNFAGTLMGMVNGFGCFSGIITPLVIKSIRVKESFTEWRMVFWIAMLGFSFTCVTYILLGSGEEQPWNEVNPAEEEEEEENINVI